MNFSPSPEPSTKWRVRQPPSCPVGPCTLSGSSSTFRSPDHPFRAKQPGRPKLRACGGMPNGHRFPMGCPLMPASGNVRPECASVAANPTATHPEITSPFRVKLDMISGVWLESIPHQQRGHRTGGILGDGRAWIVPHPTRCFQKTINHVALPLWIVPDKKAHIHSPSIT